VMDGAHTHHHGPSGAGIGAALALGAGLVLAASFASAVVAIVHMLLIALAITGGLAFAALITWAVIVYHQQAHARPVPTSIAEDREVVSLREAITELQAQLYAARAAQLAAGQAETHRHLHLHGLTADQVAVILAEGRQAGDGE